jgi:ankyrin repeat protein
MFSRIASSMVPQRTGSPGEATSSASTPRQPSSGSNETRSPLLPSGSVDDLARARKAVRDDNLKELQELLRQRPALLTVPFENRDTLLTEAAGTGKRVAVAVILAQANDARQVPFEDVVNHCNAEGRSALAQAILNGHAVLANSLAENKAVAKGNPEVADALRRGQLDVAKSLVAGGPSGTDKALSEAHSAAVGGDTNRLQALLRQHPELLTQRLENDKTLLIAAAGAGKVDSVQAILMQASISRPAEFKDIVNQRDTYGDTALAQAVRRGKLQVATSLLAYPETDVNLANHMGETPLHHVAIAKTPEFAKPLLGHASILVSPPDRNGNTPLHRAIEYRNTEVALMIAAHSEGLPDQPNHRQRTPLATAVRYKDLKVIDALLSNEKVDPNRPDKSGLPPLWQALTDWKSDLERGRPGEELSNWQRMLGKLVASPKVNATTPITRGDASETPLTYLCKQSRPGGIKPSDFMAWRVKTVETLLNSSQHDNRSHSLDPGATNSAGRTAYQSAQEWPDPALAQVLMQASRQRPQA